MIRVSSVELSVVFSVEKMSVEKNMILNSTINNTKFFLKNNVLPQSLLLFHRVSSVELSVVFSVEKMSVEKGHIYS